MDGATDDTGVPPKRVFQPDADCEGERGDRSRMVTLHFTLTHSFTRDWQLGHSFRSSTL